MKVIKDYRQEIRWIESDSGLFMFDGMSWKKWIDTYFGFANNDEIAKLEEYIRGQGSSVQM